MSALGISITPGYQFQGTEALTNDKLNALGKPTVNLTGSIGAATINDGAVVTAKLADGALSADATGRGKMATGYITSDKLGAQSVAAAAVGSGVVQQVYVESSTFGDTVAVIPADNTTPQVGEGTQILSGTITPVNAGSTILVELALEMTSSTTDGFIAALFQDGAANAIAASMSGCPTSLAKQQVVFRKRVNSTGASMVFTVRIGSTSAGQHTYLNSNVFLNGAITSTMVIKELL